MAPYPTLYPHHSEDSGRQEPVWPAASSASIHKYTRGRVCKVKPAHGKKAKYSEVTGDYKSQLYTDEEYNYTFNGSVNGKVSEEKMNDNCGDECKYDFSNRNNREEDHEMLNIPGHCLETYRISNDEDQNEMSDGKQAFTTDNDGKKDSKKIAIETFNSGNFLVINSNDRQRCLGTTDSDNIQKNSRKSGNPSFGNNPKTILNKSKYSTATVLPPCRICGARASGLHYGVNSCEACKGFFRRALKRPMVFKCSKSKKCDVKGNKRSTCRFCRFKKCLSLGMARESIKTGRYSYKKRTRDTIEVKRLQRLPNLITSEPDLDIVTKNLLTAHDYLMVSTIDAPNDWIYQKQIEYHNIYLLYKKFGNHPELTTEKFADHSFGYDNPSRPLNNKNCQNLLNKSGQQPSPSGSMSQLSSDSGFVDELVTNGYTSAISSNGYFSKLEDSPKCPPDSNDYAKEQRTETLCVNNTNQNNISGAKEFEQTSATQICSLSCYNQCSLCRDYSPSIDRDPLGKAFSEEDTQTVSNVCCCERKSRINNVDRCQGQKKIKTANLKITDDCQNFDECLSNEKFSNADKIPSAKNYHSFANCNKCGKRKTIISQDVSSRKCEDVPQIHDSGSSLENSNSSSDAVVNSGNTKSKTFRRGGRYRSSDDTGGDDRHDNTPRHTAAAKSGQSLDAGANSWSLGQRGSYLSSRGESESQIVHRAKTWLQGYVDFAKEIPGFSSLPCQDQSALLKYAWDEVWLLGTYRGYNKTLGVAMTPRGTCAHADEMENGWGRHYSRFAFIMAGIIKRYNLSRQLMVLLKVVCIVAPDRCPLIDTDKVSEIHWMAVSCLQRHAEKSHPGNCQIFPRLISILTSLRELSESAKRDTGTRHFTSDYNILSQTLMPF